MTDETRFSCSVQPIADFIGWQWVVSRSDGSQVHASSALSMAQALSDAAEWVRAYPYSDGES